MPRGKPLKITTLRQILQMELLGLDHHEIAQRLGLNKQTIDRAKQRDEFLSLKKMLAEHLLSLSTSEIRGEI